MPAEKREIPATLPEQDELTPEQEALIEAFVATYLPKDNLPIAYVNDCSDEDLRITAYKYLVARKWVLQDAGDMFVGAMAYREKVEFDGHPVFPTPIPIRGYDVDDLNACFNLAPRQPGYIDKVFNSVKSCQHSAFHKWDKSGHPVLIDCAGKANVASLVAKFKQMTPPNQDIAQISIDLHTHQNIVGSHLVRYQDRRVGAHYKRRITTATIIMDCKGLGLGHLFGEAVEITKKSWGIDSQFFPEGMHRMFVVNCPGMIMFAYNLFKGMIDPRTQQKVIFCSEAETADVLRSVIDEDCLPEFLGGKCNCVGGCVFNTSESEDATAEDADCAEIKTEDITVGAGDAVHRSFSVEANHQIVWSFESNSGSDVEFSVVFTPTSGPPRVIVPAVRCKQAEDSFTATETGRIVVEWSNKFSWLKSKSLRLRVAKISETGGYDAMSPCPMSPSSPRIHRQ